MAAHTVERDVTGSYYGRSVLFHRVGEKAFQRIGLVTPSNDANTGDIGQPLQNFAQMRDGLKDIQAQVRRFVCFARGPLRLVFDLSRESGVLYFSKA